MAKLFETYEIGSLAKHNWRLKGYSGVKLAPEDIVEAETWGRRLGIDYKPLTKLLTGNAQDKKQQVVNWSTLYAVRMFEKLGLDYVYTGEQWREEMYAHVAKNVEGFEFTGWIKSFDYRYYRKATVVSEVKYRDPFYFDEYTYIKPYAKAQLKVPITGPYTMTDWSFNEHYWAKLGKVKSLKERKNRARRELILDVVDNVLRPELRKLIDTGANWIQVDEPALTTQPTAEEMSLFVEAWNRLVAGLSCRFSLHNCYSDYQLLARYAPDLKNCHQLSLEFANRDMKKPGRKRPAYDLIKSFEEHGYEGAYAPGFVHVHTDENASPEIIRDRILCVADIVGADRVYVAPDCGLRTRDWDTAYMKLENLVKGAELAREEF